MSRRVIKKIRKCSVSIILAASMVAGMGSNVFAADANKTDEILGDLNLEELGLGDINLEDLNLEELGLGDINLDDFDIDEETLAELEKLIEENVSEEDIQAFLDSIANINVDEMVEDAKQLVILYTGDLMGDFSSMAKLAEFKKGFEEEDMEVLLLDLGNLISPEDIEKYESDLLASIMEAVGYDAISLNDIDINALAETFNVFDGLDIFSVADVPRIGFVVIPSDDKEDIDVAKQEAKRLVDDKCTYVIGIAAEGSVAEDEELNECIDAFISPEYCAAQNVGMLVVDENGILSGSMPLTIFESENTDVAKMVAEFYGDAEEETLELVENETEEAVEEAAEEEAVEEVAEEEAVEEAAEEEAAEEEAVEEEAVEEEAAEEEIVEEEVVEEEAVEEEAVEEEVAEEEVAKEATVTIDSQVEEDVIEDITAQILSVIKAEFGEVTEDDVDNAKEFAENLVYGIEDLVANTTPEDLDAFIEMMKEYGVDIDGYVEDAQAFADAINNFGEDDIDELLATLPGEFTVEDVEALISEFGIDFTYEDAEAIIVDSVNSVTIDDVVGLFSQVTDQINIDDIKDLLPQVEFDVSIDDLELLLPFVDGDVTMEDLETLIPDVEVDITFEELQAVADYVTEEVAAIDLVQLAKDSGVYFTAEDVNALVESVANEISPEEIEAILELADYDVYADDINNLLSMVSAEYDITLEDVEEMLNQVNELTVEDFEAVLGSVTEEIKADDIIAALTELGIEADDAQVEAIIEEFAVDFDEFAKTLIYEESDTDAKADVKEDKKEVKKEETKKEEVVVEEKEEVSTDTVEASTTDAAKEENVAEVTEAKEEVEEATVETVEEAPAAEAPATETVSAPAASIASGLYVVNAGDCLWSIAQRAYGNGANWNVIFQANAAQLSSPSMIFPGQVIVIP